MRPLDTTPYGYGMQFEIHGRMGGSGRLRTAMALSDRLRELAFARIRSEHPGWSHQEIIRAYAKEVLKVNLPVE